MTITRRSCLAALAAGAALPMVSKTAWANSANDIDWPDLIPPEAQFSSMRGIVEHGAPKLRYTKEQGQTLNTALDGQTVRMPGFILPTEFDGTAVTGFLLVPYFGACIHVPPPPPNQMVFVTYEKGFKNGRLFSAVTVTGRMQAGIARTAVAPVGYTMTAESVDLFEA